MSSPRTQPRGEPLFPSMPPFPHLPRWSVCVCQLPCSHHGCAPQPGCDSSLPLSAHRLQKQILGCKILGCTERAVGPPVPGAMAMLHSWKSPFWQSTTGGPCLGHLCSCTSIPSSCQTCSGPTCSGETRQQLPPLARPRWQAAAEAVDRLEGSLYNLV